MAEVHCRGDLVPRLPVGLVREEEPRREMETKLGCDPGERDQGRCRRHRDARPIAAHARRERCPTATRRSDGEPDREHDAGGGDRVRGLRVEVVLVDDPRPGDVGAER